MTRFPNGAGGSSDPGPEAAPVAWSAKRSEQMKRSAENKLRVVAVRIDPVIEQRLRVLAEATGRKQSFFRSA
jgi:hypothetical protein